MKRYNIYSYLDYDKPSGEPQAGWDDRPEDDGVYVYFNEAYEIQKERDAARARAAELEGLLRKIRPHIPYNAIDREKANGAPISECYLNTMTDAALAAGKDTK